MKTEYIQRIYNLIFAIFILITFYFSYQSAKSYLRDYVTTQTDKEYDTYRQAHDERYDELLKQGKQKEADEYGKLADQFVLTDIPITMDVTADPAAQKIKWMQFRLRLVRNQQTLIALFVPLSAYTVLYFLVWQIASLSVRYVKGNLSRTPKS